MIKNEITDKVKTFHSIHSSQQNYKQAFFRICGNIKIPTDCQPGLQHNKSKSWLCRC